MLLRNLCIPVGMLRVRNMGSERKKLISALALPISIYEKKLLMNWLTGFSRIETGK
jgi:hypothetical protein